MKTQRLSGLLCFFVLLMVFVADEIEASPLQESLSFNLEIKGDLQGLFEFSGAWGDKLESVNELANNSNQFCSSLEVLVRKVSLASQNQVEIWPTLTCTLQGQKKQFKLHRMHFKANETVQKKKIKSLDLQAQNIEIEFRDFSIQKSK